MLDVALDCQEESLKVKLVLIIDEHKSHEIHVF